jgi:hypothetical protein
VPISIPFHDRGDRRVVRREVGAPVERHHGDLILRQQPRLEERQQRRQLFRRSAHAQRRTPQHDQEDAAVLRLQIRRGNRRPPQSRRGFGRRGVHGQRLRREVADRLDDPVFGDGEVRLRQIGDRLAVAIEHAHVERNNRDAASEGRLRRLLRGALLRNGSEKAASANQGQDGNRGGSPHVQTPDRQVRPEQ